MKTRAENWLTEYEDAVGLLTGKPFFNGADDLTRIAALIMIAILFTDSADAYVLSQETNLAPEQIRPVLDRMIRFRMIVLPTGDECLEIGFGGWEASHLGVAGFMADALVAAGKIGTMRTAV